MPKKTKSTTRPIRRSHRGSPNQLSKLCIRMYRQGLGDSFLLRFDKLDGSFVHIVIDCGVLIGSPNGSARIRKVVENIKRETEGTIDLLIATHEHADHLSGFNSARDL